MIEKITTKYPDFDDLKDKINEIIDTIYNMQLAISNLDPDSEWYDGNHIADISKKVDPYEAQLRWVGKLCKFWDYENEEKWFSVLEHIDKNSPYPYCASGDWWYKHCEPVGLDDEIIYKGE